MNVCISFSFLWEGFIYPFPSSLGWRSATVPTPCPPALQEAAVLVMLLLKATVVRCPLFLQLSLTTMASVLFYLFMYLFLTFCSLSAFPLPIYTWVSILPDRHLDPAPSMPSGPVCASCPCSSLGCLQFSWILPDPFPAVSSSAGVLLKHSHVSCCCCN